MFPKGSDNHIIKPWFTVTGKELRSSRERESRLSRRGGGGKETRESPPGHCEEIGGPFAERQRIQLFLANGV